MILLLFLTAAPVQNAEDWYALLQTRYTWECTADWMIASNELEVLDRGLPLGAVGSLPRGLPWPDATVTDPLGSGVWGGGMWNTWVSDGAFQDSLSFSRIGLIQNTLDHSRYSFELDRPLPWGLSGNFEMARDDTVAVNSMVLRRDRLDLKVVSWEGNSYGWGCWSNWKDGSWYARAGFSRLSPDDRRPEILAGTVISDQDRGLELELGGACALVDSSLEYRAVAGGSMELSGLLFSIAGEYDGETGESFWGGTTWRTGDFSVSAAHSSPGEGEAFQTVALRHSVFNVTARLSSNEAVAADVSLQWGFLRGQAAAGWFFDQDSLEADGYLLAGHDWYRGRFEAGPRILASMNNREEWNTRVDIVAGFTLLPFSIGAGVENMLSELDRSWSFGITWGFTDLPPQVPEGGENDRGQS